MQFDNATSEFQKLKKICQVDALDSAASKFGLGWCSSYL